MYWYLERFVNTSRFISLIIKYSNWCWAVVDLGLFRPLIFSYCFNIERTIIFIISKVRQTYYSKTIIMQILHFSIKKRDISTLRRSKIIYLMVCQYRYGVYYAIMIVFSLIINFLYKYLKYFSVIM